LRLLQLFLAALALSALAPAARAQYRSSPFSYNYLDINYVRTELEDVLSEVPTLTGFGGRLSFDSPEGVRVLLGYNETSADATIGAITHHVIRQDLEVGVGFITSPSDLVDLVLDIKYLRGELQRPIDNSGSTPNRTRTGYGIEFGMRSLLHELVEFDLSGEFRDYFVSEIGVHAGLLLMFTKNFGLGTRYSWFEKSQQTLTVGLRLAI
jgi:hypothetical protein